MDNLKNDLWRFPGELDGKDSSWLTLTEADGLSPACTSTALITDFGVIRISGHWSDSTCNLNRSVTYDHRLLSDPFATLQHESYNLEGSWKWSKTEPLETIFCGTASNHSSRHNCRLLSILIITRVEPCYLDDNLDCQTSSIFSLSTYCWVMDRDKQQVTVRKAETIRCESTRCIKDFLSKETTSPAALILPWSHIQAFCNSRSATEDFPLTHTRLETFLDQHG